MVFQGKPGKLQEMSGPEGKDCHPRDNTNMGNARRHSPYSDRMTGTYSNQHFPRIVRLECFNVSGFPMYSSNVAHPTEVAERERFLQPGPDLHCGG
jgi:hypothetical protein